MRAVPQLTHPGGGCASVPRHYNEHSRRAVRAHRVGRPVVEGHDQATAAAVGTGKGSVMTRLEAVTLAARGLSTTGLQGWIQDNVVPLVLLGIAIILLWIGGRGDNAGVARRSVGLLVGLVALGIAVSGNGPEIGNFLAGLLIG